MLNVSFPVIKLAFVLIVIGNLLFSSNSIAKDNLTALKIETASINKKVDLIQESLNKVNDGIKASKDAQIVEKENKLIALEKTIKENSLENFSNQSSILNILIGIASFVITASGLVLVYLAFLGLSNIKQMKLDLREDLESMLLNSFNKSFSEESSKIREEFNNNIAELSNRIEMLNQDSASTTSSAEAPADNKPNPNENAFG